MTIRLGDAFSELFQQMKHDRAVRKEILREFRNNTAATKDLTSQVSAIRVEAASHNSNSIATIQDCSKKTVDSLLEAIQKVTEDDAATPATGDTKQVRVFFQLHRNLHYTLQHYF